MSETPVISVVIPLYNKGPYIARALNSVLAQTFQDFEAIVVDDGSTDDGASIANAFDDSRIRLIQQENQGVSSARNRGIEASRAELIAFLDADDEWLPGHLEVIDRLRLEWPEAGAYTTAYLRKSRGLFQLKPSPNVGIPKKPWEGLIPNYFRAATNGNMIISSSTVAVPKSILIKMGGFSTETWWGEDGDLWGRIALKYPIAFSWGGMGIYHTDAMNRALARVEPVLIENTFVTSAQNALRAGEVSQDVKPDLIEYIAAVKICVANHNISIGRPDLARKTLKDCKTHRQSRLKYRALFWSLVPSSLFDVLRKCKCLIKNKRNTNYRSKPTYEFIESE